MSFPIELLRQWARQRKTVGARVVKWDDVPDAQKGTTPKRRRILTPMPERCAAALPRVDRKTSRCFFERCAKRRKVGEWCKSHKGGVKVSTRPPKKERDDGNRNLESNP